MVTLVCCGVVVDDEVVAEDWCVEGVHASSNHTDCKQNEQEHFFLQLKRLVFFLHFLLSRSSFVFILKKKMCHGDG